jgi:cupin superfamily acireductone dioxygenase involved in methionine salvage
MADFDSWSKESLVQFARDSQEKMREQQEEIKRLQMQLDFSQQDVTCALLAYRELLRGLPQERH